MSRVRLILGSILIVAAFVLVVWLMTKGAGGLASNR